MPLHLSTLMHSTVNAIHYFSLEEAEALLPKIRKLLRQLQALDKALEMIDGVEVEVDDEYEGEVPCLTTISKEYHRLSFQFYATLEKVEQMGFILKDLDEGLVDFPHRFEDRDVFLCWKVDEKKIGHWHDLEEGYESRQKILR